MMPKTIYITTIILFSAWLLAGCGGDSADDVQRPVEKQNQEISFKADVWKMAEATRATTYDNAAALQDQGSFTCYAYTVNTTTLNNDADIKGIPVTWNNSLNQWKFETIHHWPANDDHLDFFAYMPKSSDLSTQSPFISDITYSVIDTNADSQPDAQQVAFNCTNIFVNNGAQSSDYREFVYGLVPNQDKTHNGSGVVLTFQHPFTRIKLQFSSSQENIQINSITLKNIQNNGSYLHSTGWTPSGDATNLVLEFEAANFVANEEIGTYLMIPQTWSGGIDVNATWNVWDEPQTKTVSTTLSSVTWQRGYSYTYTFTVTPTDLTVNTSKFTEQW